MLKCTLEDFFLLERIKDPTMPKAMLQNLLDLSEAKVYKKVQKGSFFYLRSSDGIPYSAVYIKDKKLCFIEDERPEDDQCPRFCEMVNEFFPDLIEWLITKYEIQETISQYELEERE